MACMTMESNALIAALRA